MIIDRHDDGDHCLFDESKWVEYYLLLDETGESCWTSSIELCFAEIVKRPNADEIDDILFADMCEQEISETKYMIWGYEQPPYDEFRKWFDEQNGFVDEDEYPDLDEYPDFAKMDQEIRDKKWNELISDRKKECSKYKTQLSAATERYEQWKAAHDGMDADSYKLSLIRE